jgi:hypothetical protein
MRSYLKEGVHRLVIADRALAKELQVSVNHNDLGYLEKALEHLLSAEKLVSSRLRARSEPATRPEHPGRADHHL